MEARLAEDALHERLRVGRVALHVAGDGRQLGADDGEHRVHTGPADGPSVVSAAARGLRGSIGRGDDTQ